MRERMGEQMASASEDSLEVTPAPRCNIIQNLILVPAVSDLNGNDAVGISGEGVMSGEISDITDPIPVVHIEDSEIDNLAPEFIDFADEFERLINNAKLDTSASVADVSNVAVGPLTNFTPPLVAPLAEDAATSAVSNEAVSSSILKNLLHRPTEKTQPLGGKRRLTAERKNTDSDLSENVFNPEEKNTINSFFKIYESVKKGHEDSIRALQKTEVELQQAREEVKKLEKKLEQQLRNIEESEKKRIKLEEGVKKYFNFN